MITLDRVLIDHLVYAVPSLPAAIADVAERFGVRAQAGGKHTGLGTHNAREAISSVKTGEDSGFWESWVHHSPPNPPRSPDPPGKEPRTGLRGSGPGLSPADDLRDAL